MNRWGIPAWLERHVIDRDRKCVYCRVEFDSCGTRRSAATWEHIVNDARIVTPENIARCCFSCNASKGARDLAEWLASDYCRRKRITPATVAEVVRRALEEPPAPPDR